MQSARDTPMDIHSARSSLVPSSRSLSPILSIRKVPLPTPPKDDSPSNATGEKLAVTLPLVEGPSGTEDRNSGNEVDADKDDGTDTGTTTRPTAVVATAPLNNSPGSPSPSAIDEEASVLQMVTRPAGPGSSVHGSPSLKSAVLDAEELDAGIVHMEDDKLIPSAAPRLSMSPLTITSASTPTSVVFSSSPRVDDELSDLTSISDSEDGRSAVGSQRSRPGTGPDDSERPKKRAKLNGNAAGVKVKEEVVARSLGSQSAKKRGRKSKATGSVVVKQEPGTSASAKTKQKLGRKRRSTAGVVWPEKVLDNEGNSGTVSCFYLRKRLCSKPFV
ncbi:hypothetical protein BT96DRAFT_54065 [Gymnopus androsaceus JB14]|uniref:Uncharacterized protein n=1 Tax=Gymnopus androsaceus JB14 TaxID=1447944 RepID=A0A6A4IF61_9AGAR|nr:hypothetical protein BT96DRAFT_54065 [Gymnopus androsaceus JB14]